MTRTAYLMTGVLVVATAIAFGGGWYLGARERNALIELMATDHLARRLFVLSSIDENKLDEAKRVLQAETNEQLDWMIEYGNLNRSADRLEYKCSLLKRLKAYRKQHRLFEGGDWEYLWKVPGMREAEEQRKAFLERSC